MQMGSAQPREALLDRSPPELAQGPAPWQGGLQHRLAPPLVMLSTGLAAFLTRTIVATGTFKWPVNANGLPVQRVVRAQARREWG